MWIACGFAESVVRKGVRNNMKSVCGLFEAKTEGGM
jgi:hypothetical protein